MTGRDILLYDADCGFCRWCVAKVLAWDRRGRLVPMALQDPRADQLLAGVPPGARWGSWHHVGAGGEVRSGGAGAGAAMRSLPGGRLPAALVASAPGLSERLYRLVADRRAVLGRMVTAGGRTRALRRIAGRTPEGGHAPTGAEAPSCARRI